ncbi:MAG TPA: fasciclin domain-containing protein [Ferruginibacter sp.]|nr:fasciclin domain-containing protein [Ferruginibacter sp.]
MINKIKNLIKIPLILLFCSVLFVQCDKDDDAVVSGGSLDEVLAKDGDLSMFKAAIAQAKLETFTKGPGPFTIFAPTNAAFTTAGITSATLAAMDSITLTALVLTHFQISPNGTFTGRTSFEIPEGPNAPMTSIAGFSIYAYQDKAAGKIFLNGAQVTERDIYTRNGIIHKINKVLLPPAFSIISLLTANPNYSLLVQAITKTALTAVYSPATTAPATIFALPNSVMTANGYDAAAITAIPPASAALTTLTNILRYHVVASRNFSTDLKAGTLKTTYVVATVPTTVTVSLGTGVSVKGVSNPGPFLLGPTDLAATNGVIHSIAGMLKP